MFVFHGFKCCNVIDSYQRNVTATIVLLFKFTVWNENFPWWSKFSPTLKGVFPIMSRDFFSSVDFVFSLLGVSSVLSFLRIFSRTSFPDPWVLWTISRVGSHNRSDLSLSLSFFFLLKSRTFSRKFSKLFWIDLKHDLMFSIWSLLKLVLNLKHSFSIIRNFLIWKQIQNAQF